MAKDLHLTYRWRFVVSPLVRQCNPICQFLDKHTGQQCTRPTEVVHHLVDQKQNATLFFEWKNLVAVCLFHHSGGQVGDTQNYAYVDTLGPNESVYQHGHGLPHSHKDFVAPTPLDEIYSMATQGGW